jgi:hypothetical protein
MKKLFVMFLLCTMCSMQMLAADESAALPLPNSGNVTLTLDEYNKLVELAGKPPKKSDVAPLPYSLQHADLKLEVKDDCVHGTVQLDGEVFHKGVSKVPLTSGMTILDARENDAHQNGKGVPLEQENGTQTALISGPGEFSVDLETGLSLHIEAGRASFRLPVPAAGSAQLSLTIPGDHTLANLSPGLITSRKSENGHTVIEATLAPGQPTNIWWATREVVAPAVPRETRFLANAKTLVSVSEAEMRVTVLADITVVQGQPSQYEVKVPEGYEITGVTGATVDSTETKPGLLTINVNAPTRSHEFLIAMERPLAGSTPNGFKADAPIISFKGAQRETGEILVEGAGTMEITATEGGGLKRMDVKEVNPYLRSLAHYPPQAAFRYHRQPDETPTLALDWVRFPDGSVLAAVAERATVTTMVTSEGRSLTEVRLTVKNQAQPFLKIALPAGVTILSADVAGERVKPVQGPDGSRVPLLRPGFRPTGSYEVSFVFMHSGAPFAKKGGAELSLPNMDIPISLLNWEIFLPEQYKVKDFGGDVIAANLVQTAFRDVYVRNGLGEIGQASTIELRNQVAVMHGQMGGYVTDPSGAALSNARITVTDSRNGFSRSAISDSAGRWVVSGLDSGNYNIQSEATGFNTTVLNTAYDANQPAMYSTRMNIGNTAQTIEVMAEAPVVQTGSATLGTVTDSGTNSFHSNGRNFNKLVSLAPGATAQNQASANVLNLQKRVAGVLPVPVEVPHAGTSFSFVRPLVLDEETKVTFSYKSR